MLENLFLLLLNEEPRFSNPKYAVACAHLKFLVGNYHPGHFWGLQLPICFSAANTTIVSSVIKLKILVFLLKRAWQMFLYLLHFSSLTFKMLKFLLVGLEVLLFVFSEEKSPYFL